MFEDDFMRYIKGWFIRGFIFIIFIEVIFSMLEDKPEVDNSEPYWKNEDKSIHPKDVSSYDYDNRVINYRDYTPYNDSSKYEPILDDEIDIETLIDLYED